MNYKDILSDALNAMKSSLSTVLDDSKETWNCGSIICYDEWEEQHGRLWRKLPENNCIMYNLSLMAMQRQAHEITNFEAVGDTSHVSVLSYNDLPKGYYYTLFRVDDIDTDQYLYPAHEKTAEDFASSTIVIALMPESEYEYAGCHSCLPTHLSCAPSSFQIISQKHVETHISDDLKKSLNGLSSTK